MAKKKKVQGCEPVAKKSVAVQEKKPDAVAVVNHESLTPMAMIAQAQANHASLDEIRAFMDLQDRWERNEAHKKYVVAFAAAQMKIESVAKTKLNPQTNSHYAELGNIIEATKSIYSAAGFAIIFYEADAPKPEFIRVCADVVHEAGHKETFHYDVPLDGVGIKGNANMTAIHGKASSTTYGRRYLMCMIWNIATEDDDGNSARPGPRMDEGVLGDWIQKLNESDTVEKLTKNFGDAWRTAKKTGDEDAVQTLIQTRDNCQKAMNAKKAGRP